MEDDAEKGTVDLKAAVILYEAKLLKFVHEEIHTGTRGADRVGEGFLRNFREMILGLSFFTVARFNNNSARASRFSVELNSWSTRSASDANVPREHVSYKAVGELVLGVKNARHLFLINYENRRRRDRGRGSDAERLRRETSFAEEIAGTQNCNNSFFANASFTTDSFTPPC